MSILYVPVLKGKEGEYGALEELVGSSRNVMLPLIDVPSVPYDFANERLAKTLDDHIAPIAPRLARCWKSRELYVDTPWFGDEEFLEDGTVAISRVLRGCADNGVVATPVIRRTSSTAYLAAVRAHVAMTQGAFCLRLVESDFDDDTDTDPVGLVLRLLRAIDGNPNRGDLILDLADIGLDVSRATLVARSILSMAPRLNEWRRVVLVAASFPENLSDVGAATTSRLPRIECQLWDRLRRRGTLRGDLIFGDYAVAHPVPTELDPRTMRMSASIRYTTREEWLVVKGRNVRQYGFDQYFFLANELVQLPDYSGADFSWGDQFIDRCAKRQTGPGNATTWRKVGTNHHLTLVARQLAANVPVSA